MNLTICNDILGRVPQFRVIAYTMDVENKLTNELTLYIDKLKFEYSNRYDLTKIVTIPKLKQTRDGYKALGKDPSHTRPACEALLRRFVKGDGIYRLGDIIDLGNVLSLLTSRSVCVVDANKIKGSIIIRQGNENESYEALNRGKLNISKLPVYCDELGPFGCPTSDTLRTSISEETTKILIMLICFSEEEINEDTNLMISLFKKYVNAKNIEKIEVNYGKF